jgi:hypothetical protein
MFNFEDESELTWVKGFNGALVERVTRTEGHRLRVATSHLQESPGVRLTAAAGHWDLDSYNAIELEVYNPAANVAWVYGDIESDHRGSYNSNRGSIRVPPRSSRTLQILFRRIPPAKGSPLDSYFIGMRGLPGGYVRHWSTLAPKKTVQLSVFLPESRVDQVFEIDNIRAVSKYDPPSEEALRSGFFPLVDEFGQYKYKSWPGKISSAADMQQNHQLELVDLEENPGPASWNRYGGWATGPRLKATGYFRVEKFQGRWWLVDPEGALFWSHGIDCVRPNNAETPLGDREHYFESLPEGSSPFVQFYGARDGASRGYYQHKKTRTYNFTGANLFRKFGEGWLKTFSEMSHRRLRSWGINTIGNWSDESIYLQRKTPYVANISFTSRKIEGSEGTWGKFPDVFDPSFRSNVRTSMLEEEGKSIGDPWCLGYFVNNELTWGDSSYLGVAALRSPPDQPAKKALVEQLRSKYATVSSLNKTWGTEYESWADVAGRREAPDVEKLTEDLEAFYSLLARTYFKTIRDEIRNLAPDALYLGCRFSSSNETAVRASAEFCDVVSFNRYRRSLAGFRLPEGIDRPVIIGEFHFGALDRGKLHTGLRSVANQIERGEAYQHYVETALLHPSIVGTHWFQFGDQATTGRFDGENYQIGFVDSCDLPYKETIDASRRVGYPLYRFRSFGGEQ